MYPPAPSDATRARAVTPLAVVLSALLHSAKPRGAAASLAPSRVPAAAMRATILDFKRRRCSGAIAVLSRARRNTSSVSGLRLIVVSTRHDDGNVLQLSRNRFLRREGASTRCSRWCRLLLQSLGPSSARARPARRPHACLRRARPATLERGARL